jgi:hypothetical protein
MTTLTFQTSFWLALISVAPLGPIRLRAAEYDQCLVNRSTWAQIDSGLTRLGVTVAVVAPTRTLYPATSIDQHSATLVSWFGVSPTDLPMVRPTGGCVVTPNRGFLA